MKSTTVVGACSIGLRTLCSYSPALCYSEFLKECPEGVDEVDRSYL